MRFQLVFAPHRQYGLSVAVWWYIHVRPWVELLVTQGLMQVETPDSRKHQHKAKATKMVTPPHIIVV